MAANMTRAELVAEAKRLFRHAMHVSAHDSRGRVPDKIAATKALDAAIDELAAHQAEGWQPISTAEKGGGAELVTDPAYVDPPSMLLLFANSAVAVGKWDWYYAEGGNGADETNGCGWIDTNELNPLYPCHGEPTHWMPLPAAPPIPSNGGAGELVRAEPWLKSAEVRERLEGSE